MVTLKTSQFGPSSKRPSQFLPHHCNQVNFITHSNIKSISMPRHHKNRLNFIQTLEISHPQPPHQKQVQFRSLHWYQSQFRSPTLKSSQFRSLTLYPNQVHPYTEIKSSSIPHIDMQRISNILFKAQNCRYKSCCTRTCGSTRSPYEPCHICSVPWPARKNPVDKVPPVPSCWQSSTCRILSGQNCWLNNAAVRRSW